MNIVVSNMARSAPFYTAMFRHLGYELGGEDAQHQDWGRRDLDTPHEISIWQVDERDADVPHVRGAVGHHDHVAFCASSRDDVDRFYREVLVPLEKQGQCVVEDPPCDCPEYADGYYATFFFDPDGLKYEFVINPHFPKPKSERAGGRSTK